MHLKVQQIRFTYDSFQTVTTASTQYISGSAFRGTPFRERFKWSKMYYNIDIEHL